MPAFIKSADDIESINELRMLLCDRFGVFPDKDGVIDFLEIGKDIQFMITMKESEAVLSGHYQDSKVTLPYGEDWMDKIIEFTENAVPPQSRGKRMTLMEFYNRPA